MVPLKRLVLVCLGFLMACGAAPEPGAPQALAGVQQALSANVLPSQLFFGEVRVGEQRLLSVTLHNSGDTRVTVRSVSLSGPGPFSLPGSPDVPLVLEPTSSVSLQVGFKPAQEGPQSGTLTFTTDDENKPQIAVPLSGKGVRPLLSWSPTSLDFGAQRVGTTVSKTVTLTNTGSGAITLQSFSVTAGFSATFSRSLPLTLAAGAQEELAVSFSPTSTAAQTGTLTLRTTDPEQDSVAIALSGQGVAPRLVVDPRTLDFGAQEVGVSHVFALRVRNEGTANVRVSGVNIWDSPAFSVQFTPFELPPQSGRILSVIFTPSTPGNALATLTLLSDDPQGPLEVTLQGKGVKTQLDLVPSALDFGAHNLDTTTQRVLLLRNSGSSQLTVNSIVLDGSDRAFVLKPPPLPITLAPGESLSVPVLFFPRAERPEEGLVWIETGTLHTVPLRGSGVRPVLDVSTPLVDFGTQRLGTATARSMTVRNPGSGVLHVTSLKLASDVFVLNPAAPFELRPGEVRALDVFFIPSRVGEARAELLLESDDTSRPTARVLLSGTGEGAALTVDVSALDFGAQRVGSPVTRTVTASNTGATPLSVKSIAITSGAAFSVTPAAPFELAPGERRTLQVTFTPAAEGAATARLELASDAARSPEAFIALSGTGVVSALVLGPTALAFGDQTVGTDSLARETTVHNTGTTPLHVTELRVSADAPFRVTPSAPFELAPGQSRNLSVSFRPESAGEHTATLTLVTDAARMPEATVSLLGTGVSPDEATPAPRGCASTGGGPVGAALLGLLALRRPRSRRGPAKP